jgi:hypothetical protein
MLSSSVDAEPGSIATHASEHASSTKLIIKREFDDAELRTRPRTRSEENKRFSYTTVMPSTIE